MLILDEADVAALLDFDQLAGALRVAFRSVSAGSASVPPRVGALSPAGLLGAMPGYVPGLGLGAKLVTYFRGNPSRGLPGHQAVVLLADPDDGRLLATMGGTHITAVRTAAAAAVAAEILARPDTCAITVVGSGVQARAHLDAFARIFPRARLQLAGRSPDRVAALAQEYDAVEAARSVEDGVAEADVVCLCTDSDVPLIRREWLAPGCHVSSVGSGAEVDAATVAGAHVFVESRSAATQPFPAGSRELGGRDPETVTEVGEVLLGTRPGRPSADALTLYKSMGHASQDVAAASVVYRAALGAGAGMHVEM